MKHSRTIVIALALVSLMLSCAKDPGNIDVSWQLVTNQYKNAGQHKGEVTFTNNSRYTLNNKNWTYYFSWFRTVRNTDGNDMVSGETINGDYSRLFPLENFPELKPGESITFPLVGSHYAMNFTDAPTGGYFVIKRSLGKEIILNSGDPEVLPFPEGDAYKRSAADKIGIETAADRYAQNLELKRLPVHDLPPVFPTPAFWEMKEGNCKLNKDMEIFYFSVLGNEAAYLQDEMQSLFDARIPRERFQDPEFSVYRKDRIIMKLVGGEPESYRLEIDPNAGILIYGADAAGVFYGIQSFLSLIPPEAGSGPVSEITLPAIRIEDAPRFSYRGMHLDVSRSFHGKDEIFLFLDRLAALKMNRLHFHITDDEGWRLEISGLPELTDLGAFRGHTKDERDHLQPALGSGPYTDVNIGAGSGYYTREDYIEILRYANSRHIEVIPEIDMPGHIRSAVKAMEARYHRYMAEGKPELAEMYLLTDFDDTSTYSSAQRFNDNTANPCMESTYRFVEKVVDELVAIYKEAEAPLYILHIGGDEVPRGAFAHSPIAQTFLASQDEYNSPDELHKYFTRRVSEILSKYDLHIAGWEEVACMRDNGRQVPDPSLVDEGIVTFIWNNVWGWGAEDLGYKIANTGFPIVMLNATNFYFDFAYNRHPDEPGLYWGGYTDTRSAWEFTPYDITKCAEKTIYGDPVTPEYMANKVRLTEEGLNNILGLSGALWSENLRTWERVEFMSFPKILGLAERAWSPQPEWARIEDKDTRIVEREKAWNVFANKLGQHELKRLDNAAVNYRIPPPGAVIEDGYLKANIRFPGLTLRYTLNGTVPTPESPVYTEPVRLRGNNVVKIAAFSGDGRSSRVVSVP
jgi:hexosaminidase